METTICHEIQQTHEAVVIDHVDGSTLYRDHHTPRQYGFQNYISMPITLSDGRFFGRLCAIDPKPARLGTPEVVEMFKPLRVQSDVTETRFTLIFLQKRGLGFRFVDGFQLLM